MGVEHGTSLIGDAGRLAALADRNILDTAPEAGFDDAVTIAAALCGTPVALVTMIDADRQWFKAKRGTEVTETPVEMAICTHALGGADLLVIPDLSADPRTSANPLVTGDPRVRFYAGAPLVTPEGHMLGSVCVLDTQARPAGLTAAQAEGLAALARQVLALVEMRREVEVGDAAVAQQRLLSREIGHRMKNVMALVQAIAVQTLKSVPDREAVRAFQRRLAALGAAQDVLLEEDPRATTVAAVVAAVRRIHDGEERYEVSGGEVPLGPKATLSLSLLLHELATNAAKYGAMAAPGGRVRLWWETPNGAGEPRLVLNWHEEGGPPVTPPTRTGFGSRLIGMGLAGAGGAELDYRPEGLRARFAAPLGALAPAPP